MVDVEEVKKKGLFRCTEEGIDFYQYKDRLVGIEGDEIHSNAFWPRDPAIEYHRVVGYKKV